METKVTSVQKNKPSQLIFLVPDPLTANPPYLEVRARMRDNAQLRVGRLDVTMSL